ncbi:VG15 protein [Streptomyces lasiicapitis]|uniref:VG15 protein n=1 Tax=Streptomyces lasiicapitis TaxID=1923961 RepID=UPI00367F2DE8
MASTVSDSGAGAARWRAAQAGLTTMLMRDLRSVRRLINPGRLQATVPTWIEAVLAIVTRYSDVSATLAADFYDGERDAAGVVGPFMVPFMVPLADPPPDEQTSNSLRWATKDLWPRREGEATAAQLEPLDVRFEAAMAKADGAVDRLVLNTGRSTVTQAVRRDQGAVAYARAAALGACSFCKLMAARGATYKDLDSVGRVANSGFIGEDSVIKFHNFCRCQPIPVFRGQRFELSPHAAEWGRLYREHAQGHPGDQLRLFRRALAEHDENPLPGSF